MKHFLVILLSSAVFVACAASSPRAAAPSATVDAVTPGDRAHVAEALRERFRLATHPMVAFMRDSTHLNIQIPDGALPRLSDSEFDTQARVMATHALRVYERAAVVDSVTVSEVDVVIPNALVRIKRMRVFPSPVLNAGAN